MKLLCSILLVCLAAGCATKKEARFMRSVEVPGTGIAASDMPKVRTPETVKAYPVGRYADPNFPDQMRERHTIYRREQSAQWNYRPSQPYALPLGPVIATSNPSSSYFVKTNAEQINAQQKAYAESLLEQNIALKKRIDALQQKDSTIRDLQTEIERLRMELDSRSLPESTPSAPGTRPVETDDFSQTDTLDFTDPGEVVFFPRSEADYEAFLISQMRLHDELLAEFNSSIRRRFEAPFRTQSSFTDFLHTHPKDAMNHIKLSLRAADDPRTIKEEAGLPTFASVFSLHNSTSSTRSEVIPVTVKAFNELAVTAVAELKKGVAFVVEGRLAYYKNPDTNRESYSIVADRFTDISPPKSTAVKAD